MKFITKKSLLLTTILLTIFGSIYIEFVNSEWCKLNNVCSPFHWSDFWTKTVPIFFIALVVSVLPVSLIAFFVSNTVFERWKKFAIWATPVVIALVMLVTSSGGGGFFGFDFGFDLVLIWFLFILYFLTSLIIIFRAWRKERKGKGNK